MNVSRVVRALRWSVVVCAVTVALLAGLIQAAQVGGSLQAMLVMTGYFTATFAAVAVAILTPAFLFLPRVAGEFNRRTAATVGAVLAALSSILLVVAVFRGPSDPQTIGGWLTFWWSNLGSFTAGIAPFVVGGAVFGAMWAAPAEAPSPAPSPSGRRTRAIRRSTSQRVP